MKFRVGTLVAVCTCALAAATGSSAAQDKKPSTPPAAAPETNTQTPTSLADAVRLGRIDAATVNELRTNGSVDAILSVKFADTLDEDNLDAAARVYDRRKDASLNAAGSGVTERDDFEVLPAAAVRIDSEAALLKLASAPSTLTVRIDGENTTSLAQSLPLIRQPQVAAAGNQGAGTSVAVLDTGVDFERDAFGACDHAGEPGCRVAFADDFAPDDGELDDGGHGTNVAGIVAGVAPGARILGLDVFHETDDGDLSADDSDILAAVNWAIDHQTDFNIRAMNLSLGVGETYHNSECSGSAYTGPFQLARLHGILPVVAAGNDAFDHDEDFHTGVAMPACTPGAVRVGAVYDDELGEEGWSNCRDTDADADEVTCFSQTGPMLTLLAPGAEITAAGITQSGTSQATPHVAGAAAVLAAVRPRASAAKIERSLRDSGPIVEDDRTDLARHRLDLVDAVRYVNTSDAVLVDESCRANVLPANDDGSTGEIQLPFAANFFGDVYSSLYVNNNGNVTFTGPQSQYTPFTIDADTPPIIAPFFADVDTRGAGSRPGHLRRDDLRRPQGVLRQLGGRGLLLRPHRPHQQLPAAAGRSHERRHGRLRHHVQLRRDHLGDR